VVCEGRSEERKRFLLLMMVGFVTHDGGIEVFFAGWIEDICDKKLHAQQYKRTKHKIKGELENEDALSQCAAGSIIYQLFNSQAILTIWLHFPF
jgi:hypothetical protein